MRKGSIRLVAAASVIALALTGCSSKKDDAANTDKKFEIFTWWASGGEAAGLQGMIDVYKAQNPNTEFINAAVAGGAGVNAKAVLTSRLEANDPPDSFQAHAGMELDGYVRTGKLEDLTSLYASEGWDKVFPADLIKTLTVDGKIYSVPVNIHRANVLWWNPATATKAGITAAPTTLDEFFADLEKFKKAGVTGLALAGKGDWASAQWQSDGLKLGTDYTYAAAPGTVGIYQWLSDSFTLPVGAPDRNAAIAWLKVCGSKEGQDAFNPKKGSIAVRTDSDLSLYDDYLKSAAADWSKDRLVGSTVHGVNGNNALMAAYNAAVGKYFSGGFKDNAGLAKDLAAAYEAGKA